MQGDKLFPTDLRGAKEEKGILSYLKPRIHRVKVGMKSHGHANKEGGRDVPLVAPILQLGAFKPLMEKRMFFATFFAATLHLYNAAKMQKMKNYTST